MANPAVTYTFSNGSTADATQVNQNFTDIINSLTDGTKSLTIDALTCAGTATLNGAVNLGNGSIDDITVTGSLASSIPIKTNNSFDIGSSTLGLAGTYFGAPSSRTTRLRSNQSLAGSITLTLPGTVGSSGDYIESDGSGNMSWKAFQTFSTGVTNYGIAASVGSSALTISLKDAAGSNPSSGSPVKVSFRDSTAATGTYSQVTISSALSLTISSGSTLGHTSAVDEYIYVYLINNAGTAELAASTSRFFDSGSLQSTTAEGGAGAADTRTTLYSETARANVACRLIGRLKSNQATAGTWATSISEISLLPLDDGIDDSEIYLEATSGRGSTDTGVYIFTNVRKSTGTAITRATSAGNGDTFTINREGRYTIVFSHQSSAAINLCVTVNSSSLAGVVTAYSNGKRGFTISDANRNAPITWTGRLYPGDVVRAQGSANGVTGNDQTSFSIARIGD
jgi:hypothetical protein